MPDESFSFDANGNRTMAGYATGTNNRLTTDGTYNFEYDAEGNRTKRTEIATGEVVEYDSMKYGVRSTKYGVPSTEHYTDAEGGVR